MSSSHLQKKKRLKKNQIRKTSDLLNFKTISIIIKFNDVALTLQ